MGRLRRDYRHFLVDIEGVLVRDKRYVPVSGAVAWFNGLAERGIARRLVSNNTTHAPHELAADLAAAGFAVAEEDLVTVLAVGADLLRRWEKRRLLWLGAPRLADWWAGKGFALVEGDECDAVVLGVNPELTVADLDRALPALVDGGAELVALHRNAFWLDDRGERRLGPGAWSAALEIVAAERVVCVGKPEERIYRAALKSLGADAAEALFISDDPISDLVTARRLGMGTVMTLSGKYSDYGVLERLDQDDWPDVICGGVADLQEG